VPFYLENSKCMIFLAICEDVNFALLVILFLLFCLIILDGFLLLCYSIAFGVCHASPFTVYLCLTVQ
jgi:hypothetical protein